MMINETGVKKSSTLTKILVIFLVGVSLIGFFEAFVLPQLLGKTSLNSQVLVQTVHSGGMCADGPCFSEDYIYADGTRTDGPKLSSAKLDELKEIVNSWDPSILVKDEEPFCQSYVDGSDTGYILPSSSNPETTYYVCHYNDASSVQLFSFMNSLNQ